MTAQGPITAAQAAEHDAAVNAMRRALMAAVDAAERVPGGERAIGEALCAMLDTVGGGAPRYDLFGNVREDAAFWADLATPFELEAYAAAALGRIGRTTFADRARKRLFNTLWRSFTPAERKTFLERANKGD